MNKLSHIDEAGHARMVDVTEKDLTFREARAHAFVGMNRETLDLIVRGEHAKGDVLGVARVAGIQAAKQCANLIPLCHPLMLTSVEVHLDADENQIGVHINTRCKLSGQTGVEMEALTAASVAALTVYDMCKAVDKAMIIGDIKLIEKKGGKSGHWQRQSAQ